MRVCMEKKRKVARRRKNEKKGGEGRWSTIG